MSGLRFDFPIGPSNDQVFPVFPDPFLNIFDQVFPDFFTLLLDRLSDPVKGPLEILPNAQLSHTLKCPVNPPFRKLTAKTRSMTRSAVSPCVVALQPADEYFESL